MIFGKAAFEVAKTVAETVSDKIPSFKDANVSFKDMQKHPSMDRLKDKIPDCCDNTSSSTGDIDDKPTLSEEEKQKIKEETGWSDEIVDSLSSWEEYERYKNAGLEEKEINGRKCLVRSDIDWEQKDSMGLTNKERVERNLVPINNQGQKIELHHIGQQNDGPLAELTVDEHRGPNNSKILHGSQGESVIDRNLFATERSTHWKTRSEGETV